MWGPPVSSIPFVTPADHCHFSSSSPATRATQLHPRMPPEPLLTAPSFPPPLNPPLNLAPVFHGVKAINAPVTPPPATPLRRPPGPYKRAMRPPALTAPQPLSSELLRTLHRPRDELKPPPFVASGAPPHCHSSVTGEHLPSTATTSSSSPSVTGEHRRALAPALRAAVRRRRPSLRGPLRTAPWTRSMEFPVEN
jgi:hypothetical protein